MKNLKLLFSIMMASFMMTSCLVDDEAASDAFSEGPQLLVGFESSTLNATATADGSTSMAYIDVEISGIASLGYDNELIATVEADPSSTAVAGTHYNLPQNMVTLSPTNFMIGTLPIEINTTGISAPDSKTLVLNITDVNGDSSAIPNGRTSQVTITIVYLCPSVLAGVYDNSDITAATAPGVATFTETGAGSYTISALPYIYFQGGIPVAFDIIHNCSDVIITGGEIMDAGYLIVGGGTYDEVTGEVTITYTVYNGADESTGVLFDYSTTPSTYSSQ